MSDFFIKQVFEFFVMIYSGMVISFVYMLLAKYMNFFHEILFFIFAALLTRHFWYFANFGELKGHMVMGFLPVFV